MEHPRRRPVPAGGTASATRVADILLLFASGEPALGVSEVSRRLGIGKTVVHRVFQSLESRGLLVADPQHRTYRIGPAMAALGARALSDMDLRRVAVPVLDRLHDETGETATVSALVGLRRVYLDQVVSRQEIKMTVELGRAFPLHAGASSRAILAFASPQLRRQVLSGPLEALTAHTITDPTVLEASLAETVSSGVACSRCERQAGAASVAAPVFGIDGVLGAVSACGPINRFDVETVARLVPLVRQAARDVDAALRAVSP